MDFSFSDLNINSVENLPGYEARAAFTVNSATLFREDKSWENCKSLNSTKINPTWSKLAESEEDLLEHRTDDTDAFDTLYIGCEKFPFHDSFALSVSGVS